MSFMESKNINNDVNILNILIYLPIYVIPKTGNIFDHPIITIFLISPLLALKQCAILNISTSREHLYNLCTS